MANHPTSHLYSDASSSLRGNRVACTPRGGLTRYLKLAGRTATATLSVVLVLNTPTVAGKTEHEVGPLQIKEVPTVQTPETLERCHPCLPCCSPECPGDE